MLQTLLRVFAVAATLLLVSLAGAEDGPQEIKWTDLLPEGEEEVLAQLYMEQQKNLLGQSGFPGDDPPVPQIGTFNVVEELDGAFIRMPGYVLPFDYNPKGSISEFLLVPYFGACIHTPPPPPNQVVYVRTEQPVQIKELWAPVWIEGVLSTEKNLNGLGDAAYTLDLTKVEPYD
ncbi:MAG: DUF3299 domain-containing protein [Pseudomonadota bacterium]